MKKIFKNKFTYLILGFIVLLCLIVWWLYSLSPKGGGFTCKSYGPNYEYKKSKSCNDNCIPMTGTGDVKVLTCCCPDDK